MQLLLIWLSVDIEVFQVTTCLAKMGCRMCNPQGVFRLLHKSKQLSKYSCLEVVEKTPKCLLAEANVPRLTLRLVYFLDVLLYYRIRVLEEKIKQQMQTELGVRRIF